MKERRFFEYLSLLPSKTRFTKEDCEKFWREFRDLLKELIETNNEKELAILFKVSGNAFIFCSKAIEEDVQNQIVMLFYNYITKMPVLNFGNTINSIRLFYLFLQRNQPKNISIPWKPLYKLYQYVTKKSPKTIIFNGIQDVGKNILHIADLLSFCFEPDTSVELFNKFLPKMGNYSDLEGKLQTVLTSFYPRKDTHFAEWIPIVREFLYNVNNIDQIKPLIQLVNKIMQAKLDYDFSPLLQPILVQMMNFLFDDTAPLHFFECENLDTTAPFEQIVIHLARSLLFLIASPPTRQLALEKYITIMRNLHFCTKESGYNDQKFTSFISMIVLNLFTNKRKIKSKTFPESCDFSQDEIHTLLNPIVDIMMSLLKSLTNKLCYSTIKTIRIILKLDNSFTKRFFEFAMLCIENADAPQIGFIGWSVMSAVVLEAPKFDFLREQLQDIFNLATQQLFRTDLQNPLAQTIYAISSFLPFNPKNTLEGFEHFDFSSMLFNFTQAFFDSIIRLRALGGKKASLDSEFAELLSIIFSNLFDYASEECLEAIFPLVESISVDPSYLHVIQLISIFCISYFKNCPKNLTDKILLKLEHRIQTSTNHIDFEYYSCFYVSIQMVFIHTEDDIRAPLKIILPFTTHSNKNIAKEAWRAITGLLAPWSYIYIQVKSPGMPGDFYPIDQFQVEFNSLPFDTSNVALEVFEPVFNILLHETDPHILQQTLKNASHCLNYYLQFSFNVSEGDESNIPLAIKNISFYSSNSYMVKSESIKEKIMECVTRLIKDFPDNIILVNKVLNITEWYFSPQFFIYVELVDGLDTMNNKFWSCERTNKLTNVSNLRHILTTLYKKRCMSHYIPVTESVKQYFQALIPLAASRYAEIRRSVTSILTDIGCWYYPVYADDIKKLVNASDTIPTDDFLNFLMNDPTVIQPVFDVIANDPYLLCQVIYRVLSKFDIKDEVSIERFKQFLYSAHIHASTSPDNLIQPFLELLEKMKPLVQSDVSNKDNLFLLVLILTLKQCIPLDEFYLQYIFKQIVSCDMECRITARFIFHFNSVLIEPTKEKVSLDYKPTLDKFPNPFDAKIIFDPNFPLDPMNIPSNDKSQSKSENEDDEPKINKRVVEDDEDQVEKEELERELKELMKSAGMNKQNIEENSGDITNDDSKKTNKPKPTRMNSVPINALQTNPPIIKRQHSTTAVENLSVTIAATSQMNPVAAANANYAMTPRDFSIESIDDFTDEEIKEFIQNTSPPSQTSSNESNSREHSKQIAKIYESFEHATIEWSDPHLPTIFADPSIGWYRFPKKYTNKTYSKETLEKTGIKPENVVEAIIKTIQLDVGDFSGNYGGTFSKYISLFLTKESIDVMAEKIKNILLDNATIHMMATLLHIIQTVSICAHQMDFEIYKHFCLKISLPVCCVSAISPQFAEMNSNLVSNIIIGCSPIFNALLMRLFLDLSSNFPNESNIFTRSMFNNLNTATFTRPIPFLPAFDVLADKLIPFFCDNLSTYPRIISSEFISLFVSLIESTCLRQSSELYTDAFDEKREKLINYFGESIAKADITDKAVQGVLYYFLIYASRASVLALKHLIPIIFKNFRLFCETCNSSDESSEEELQTSLFILTEHSLFLYEPKLFIQLIEHSIDCLPILSSPLQQKLICQLSYLIERSALSFEKEHRKDLFDRIYHFIESTKNENVILSALEPLGKIINFMYKDIELNETTAAAIISAYNLFDEPEQIVIDAFKVIKNVLDSSPKTSLLREVVSMFWKKHADYITPKVEAALEPFRTLVPPPYIT